MSFIAILLCECLRSLVLCFLSFYFLQFPKSKAIEHSPHHDSVWLLSLRIVFVAVLWLEFDLHLETCFSAWRRLPSAFFTCLCQFLFVSLCGVSVKIPSSSQFLIFPVYPCRHQVSRLLQTNLLMFWGRFWDGNICTVTELAGNIKSKITSQIISASQHTFFCQWSASGSFCRNCSSTWLKKAPVSDMPWMMMEKKATKSLQLPSSCLNSGTGLTPGSTTWIFWGTAEVIPMCLQVAYQCF